MAQYRHVDVNPSNTSGSAFVNIYNLTVAAVVSMNSGTNPPAGAVAGMLWLDISDVGAMRVRLYDSSQFVDFAVVDSVNHRIRLALDNDRDSYLEPTGTDGQLRYVAETNTAVVFSATGVSIGTAAAAVALDIGGKTDAVRLPAGTTAQRPTAPEAGDIRYNDELGQFEGYTNDWQKILRAGDAGGGGGGASTLGGLTDVALSNQTSGQVLVATGTNTFGNGQVDTAGIASDAITSAKIADGAVETANIRDDSVTTAKIASGAIGATEIAADAITAAKVADGAIGNAAIASNSVGANELKVPNNGTNGQILQTDGDGTFTWVDKPTGGNGGGGGGTPADGSITTAKLANSAVSTAKIANDAVTSAKIADNAIGPAALNVPGNGASGQVLTSDGDGSMSWTAKGGGGSGGGGSVLGC